MGVGEGSLHLRHLVYGRHTRIITRAHTHMHKLARARAPQPSAADYVKIQMRKERERARWREYNRHMLSYHGVSLCGKLRCHRLREDSIQICTNLRRPWVLHASLCLCLSVCLPACLPACLSSVPRALGGPVALSISAGFRVGGVGGLGGLEGGGVGI